MQSLTSDKAPVSSKSFLDTQATKECGFTLNRFHVMIITQSLKENVLQLDFPQYGRDIAK